MPHAVFLRMQVTFIVRIRRGLYRHILHDFQPVGFQPYPFHGVVGEEAHLVDAYLAQDLRAHAIVALVGLVFIFSISPMPRPS